MCNIYNSIRNVANLNSFKVRKKFNHGPKQMRLSCNFLLVDSLKCHFDCRYLRKVKRSLIAAESTATALIKLIYKLAQTYVTATRAQHFAEIMIYKKLHFGWLLDLTKKKFRNI